MMLRRKRTGDTTNTDVSEEINDTDGDDDDDEAVILLEVQPSGLHQKRRRKKKLQPLQQQPQLQLLLQPTSCCWWIVLVFVVSIVVIVGAILAFIVYKVNARRRAENLFRDDFAVVGNRFKDMFLKEMRTAVSMATTVAAAVSVSSSALEAPNINIPYFDKLVAGAIESTVLSKPIFSPLLRNANERYEWQAYAQQILADSSDACNMCESRNFTVETPSDSDGKNGRLCEEKSLIAYYGIVPQHKCPELVAELKKGRCYCRPIETNDTTTNSYPAPVWAFGDSREFQIFKVEGDTPIAVKGSGPFFPVWHSESFQFDILQNMIMYDLFSDKLTKSAFKEMIRSVAPVTSPPLPRSEVLSDTSIWKNYFAGRYYDSFHRSLLVVPVLDSTFSAKIVGSIVFEIDWHNVFGVRHAAPWRYGYENEITIVVETSSGETSTYILYMATIERGDTHDSSYSDMVVETSFDDYKNLMMPTFSPEASLGKSPPSKDACYYRVRVYPSKSFHSKYYADHMSLQDVISNLVFFLVAVLVAVAAGHHYMTTRFCR